MTNITWNLYDNKGRLIRSWPATEKGECMKVTEFAKLVAEREGKKRQMSIAQIMEQLKIINELLCGELYKIIRRM